jgi:Zn-dependent protease
MLGWSINLFRVFGIRLALHASFFLLLAYYAFNGWSEGGLVGMCWRVGMIVLFFVCVVLHELGHSLTARRYGVRVQRILLTPIGGMAEFDRIPRQPSAELLITLAGPAVNFLIAALLLPVVWGPLFSDAEVASFSLPGLGVELLVANVIMGGFNLLPVFPMDGGRILRALLAMKLPYLRATYWAAMIGKILSAVLAGIAFLYLHWPMAGILFVFIFFAGDAEYRVLLRREREAQYWAELAKRVSAAEKAAAPPEPPFIVRGPD